MDEGKEENKDPRNGIRLVVDNTRSTAANAKATPQRRQALEMGVVDSARLWHVLDAKAGGAVDGDAFVTATMEALGALHDLRLAVGQLLKEDPA